jgi:ribonuclease D
MPTPLTAPIDGVPPLVVTAADFSRTIDQILTGNGPVAIDAERASGYRYSQRAYLIQLNRRGGGLHLIDPIAIGESDLWQKLSNALRDEEWIIHASTQDLPCMRELGLEPQLLFDTELGGRIAGCERVGLGPLAESLLDISLAKEHSAVDWSIRPLRAEWLNYAALDVEVLIDLRDQVEERLRVSNKLDWAKQDFAAILNAPPHLPKKDPWRRTSGMHKIRDRQTLAIIRELWTARDEYARKIDLSPGRVFNDEAIIEIATKRPLTLSDLTRIITRRSRAENPPIKMWHELLQAVLEWDVVKFPELRMPSTGLPPIKLWLDKNPLGYARLSHARAALAALSHELQVPSENLTSPDFIRRLCWNPPMLNATLSQVEVAVAETLTEFGARPWQIALVTPALAQAQLETEPLPVPEIPEGASQASESQANDPIPPESDGNYATS